MSGCSTLSVPDTVRVPVAVPALANVELPPAPVTATDAELLALDDRAFVLTLVRDRDRLREYAEQLAALLLVCR